MENLAQYQTYAMPFTIQDFVKVIGSFSIQDKLFIEKILEKDTLRYRAEMLSQRITENQISMEDIVNEVKTMRNERDTK